MAEIKEMSLNEKLEKLMDRFEEMDNKINFSSEFATEYDVNWYTDVRDALTELEQIKSAEPTKALECLENLEKEEEFDKVSQHSSYYYLLSDEALLTIKQALLKAQESEKKNAELLQALALFKQKLEDTDNIKVATTMMKQLSTNIELGKENEILREIIKSFFDKGSPLHQYIDSKFGLTIEVDNECSIMHLGKFKNVDLDEKLKEVLECQKD